MPLQIGIIVSLAIVGLMAWKVSTSKGASTLVPPPPGPPVGFIICHVQIVPSHDLSCHIRNRQKHTIQM